MFSMVEGDTMTPAAVDTMTVAVDMTADRRLRITATAADMTTEVGILTEVISVVAISEQSTVT